jgi:succinoglycan biosynthesis transport protein ExoP
MVEQTRNTLSRLATPPSQPMPRPQAAAPAVALTPKEMMAILRRHVLLIILCTIGGLVFSGALWAFLLKFYPKYTAMTYISVLPPTRVDPTQLTAPIPNKDIMYQSRLSKALLIMQQSSFENLLRNDEVRSTEWFNSFNGNIVNAMDDLKKHLYANAQRDSDYVAVAMTCGSPRESALIVNKVVELFVKDQTTNIGADILAQLAQLRSQQKSVEDDLRNAQAALDELRVSAAREGITTINGNIQNPQFNAITIRLNDLTTEKNKLQGDIKQIEANIGTLADLAKGPISVQVEHQVETDPIMLNLGERLSLLESELARLLARFGENHKAVRQIREAIKQTREERNTRQLHIAEQTRQSNWRDAQDQLVFLRSRMQEVNNNLAEAEAKQKDLDAQRARYETLATMRDERQKRLDEIKVQISKVDMMRTDPEAPKVRAVGLAPEPLKVTSPDWRIFFPGGFILGLFAGIGLAFMIELLNDLVRTPSDVSRYLHVPLLGTIPNADEDELVDGTDLCHVVRQAPYSIISESYRQMRTNLRLSGPPEATKAILVTSAAASEGKTSTAINLAATLLTEDKKVLLIDTNFRRPTSLRTFPDSTAGAYPGLSNLLTGQCSVKDAIRPTGVPNLDIIDCGPLPPDPAELLGNSRMRHVLEELRKTYDNIVLDGPPALLVSDAKLLYDVVDGVLLVLNADISRRGMAIRMLREMRAINGSILGCVLFNVKALKGGYFHETFKLYRDYQKVQLAHTI